MTLAELQAMSDDEIRVRVAEVCGWTNIGPCTCTDAENPNRGTAPDRQSGGHLPNYPRDLNACAEFERGLTDEERGDYINHLCLICRDGTDGPVTAIGKAFFASARHRCEAFLMTRGVR